jgi:hypothetical protein
MSNNDDNMRPIDGLASGKESKCSVFDCVGKGPFVVVPFGRDFATDRMSKPKTSVMLSCERPTALWEW